MTRSRNPLGCLAAASTILLLGSLAATRANAQTAHFGGVQTAIPIGVNSNGGVALDAAGDLFYADNTNNQIVERTAAGTVVNISLGGGSPQYLALDSAGNLYVTTTNPVALKRLLLSNGAFGAATTISSTFLSPAGVAVDSGSNIYVADRAANIVYKFAFSSNFYVQTPLIASGLSAPAALAIDSGNNLYIADHGNGRIAEVLAGASAAAPLITGLNSPYGVAVDANGNLAIVGATSLTYETNGSGSYTQTNLATNFVSPQGVAFDSNGAIYVDDNGGKAVIKQTVGGNLGSVNVQATGAPQTLVFVFDTAGSLNGSAPAVALTQGVAGLDYSSTGGSCTQGNAAFAASATCTVTVTFTPRYAGARNGAVVLYGSSGGQAGTGYITGTGVGPQIAFAPTGTVIAPQTGQTLNSPGGVAVDGAGNVYISDSANNRILKQTLSGGVYTVTQIAPQNGQSLNDPLGIALDGAGNLYVADSGNDRVLKETFAGGAYTAAQIAPQSPQTLKTPNGIAVDGAGNVYIADTGKNRVLKESPIGGAYTTSTVDATFNLPFAVAVDAEGNVYVDDTYGGSAVKETPSGSGYSKTFLPANNSIGYLTSIAVDAAGDVYIGNRSGDIYKELPAGSSYSQTLLVPQGSQNLSTISAIALDGQSAIYLADQGNGRVIQEVVTSPQTLSFGSSAFGVTSTTSPLTIAIANNGNAPLIFAEAASGTNPATVVGFPFDNSSTCPFASTTSSASLAAGAACSFAYDFTPTFIGSANRVSTLLTNNLNQTNYPTPIALTGAGVKDSQTITFPQPAQTGTYATGAVIPLAATASSGLPVTYQVSGPATLSGSSITITGSGTVQVTAQQFGNADFTAAAPLTDIFTVNAQTSVPSGAAFTSTEVGSATSQLVSIEFLTAGTLGSMPVLTQGARHLDFDTSTDTTSSTCVIGTAYVAGQICGWNISFSPTQVGPRYGAVVLEDGSGNVLGTSYLQGSGRGPKIAFPPQAKPGFQINGPSDPIVALAVDAAGASYFLDGITAYKYDPATGSQTVLTATNVYAGGIAVDGAGNLYITDDHANAVIKEVLVNGAYTPSTVVSTGLNNPRGIVVDGQGNLYIADNNNDRVVKEVLTSGVYAPSPVVIGTGLSSPGALFVDGSGNIYICDDDRVSKETLANGAYTQSTVVSGIGNPTGVAVDNAGNVYIAGTGVLVEETLANGVYTQSSLQDYSFTNAVAVDGRGNLYVGTGAGYEVEAYFGGPTLNFTQTTPTGTNSSPLATTITNVGTDPLLFAAPASGTNPQTGTDFQLERNADTTCPVETAGGTTGSLAVGASCTLSYIFSPTSVETESSTSIITDNSLNVVGNTQSITLTGTSSQGTQSGQTISFPQPFASYPATVTLNAVATSGLPVTYTLASGSVATLSGSTLTYTGPGTVTISADQAGNAAFSAAPTVTITYTVVQTPAHITWQPSTLKIYTGNNLTGVLDAFDTLPSTIVYTATNQSTNASSTVTSTTTLAPGSYNLTATVTPFDPVHYATTSISLLFTVQNMNLFVANATGSVSSFFNNGTVQSSVVNGGGIGAAVDSTGNVWSITADGSSVSRFSDAGVPSSPYASGLAGINAATALAIDGAGTLWTANGNGTVSAVNVSTGTAIGANPIAAAAKLNAPSSINVDGAGSLWIANSGNNTVTEIVGVAAPVVTPIANAVLNATPATRP